MPVEKTADNPHGWGYTEKRTVLEHYQLSPRIKIVVGDEIKVSKGPYWINKEGVKVSLDKMKGKWKVTNIYENSSGDIELRLIHMWPGGLFGSVSDVRVTGNEYPSPVVPSVIRRPYKVKLASPRFGKRAKKKKKVDTVKAEKQDLKSLAEFTKQLLEDD